jgi:hypothetical protein
MGSMNESGLGGYDSRQLENGIGTEGFNGAPVSLNDSASGYVTSGLLNGPGSAVNDETTPFTFGLFG